MTEQRKTETTATITLADAAGNSYTAVETTPFTRVMFLSGEWSNWTPGKTRLALSSGDPLNREGDGFVIVRTGESLTRT